MSYKGYKMSEKSKRKMSEAKKGKPSPKKGKSGVPHSEETKLKISLSNIGKKRKPFSETTKQKMSLAQIGNKNAKGCKHSLEANQQKSILRKGKPKKPFSEEHKKHISEAWTPNNKRAKGKYGFHNGIFYQSSYELNFMKLLDEYKIPYERANQFKIKYIFENQEHYYYPDFYLPREDSIIEIKSVYYLKDLKTKAKLKAAKQQFGNKFLLITEKELPELLKI